MVEPYKPIYTIKEVAQVLRMNTNSVYSLISSGQLQALNLGAMKVRGKDLENFINGYPSTLAQAGTIGQARKE